MTRATDFALLMSMIDGTASRLAADLSILQDELPQLRRQARAAPTRRSRDATRYALGGVLIALGLEGVDEVALTGLFANSARMAHWLTQARTRIGDAPFADQVRAILDDEARSAWCRQWGVHVQWHHGAALYQATVTSFVASGRTGLNERWRRDPTTVEQEYLIDRIGTLLRIVPPKLVTKGEAFDWIYEAGGNPKWWAPPVVPPHWR